MKTTNNLGLKKIELTDSPPDITVQDSNWDLIDKHLYSAVSYQKASGTGTAIILSDSTLVDGFCKTFIVTTANGSTATTINGKPLYKQGSTITPNLKKDTAVAIWYDQAGDCFFKSEEAELEAIYRDFNSLVGGIPLVAGEDLNNKYMPGIYICASETIADTLLNTPFITGGFRMTTMRSTGSTNYNSYCKQRIDANSTQVLSYERNLVNGTWSDWKKNVTGSTKVDTTLNASLWVGTTAPYTYTLSVNGATAYNNIEVITSGVLTIDEENAFSNSRIKSGTQKTNSVTLYAYGSKPSLDLPITIIVRGDI